MPSVAVHYQFFRTGPQHIEDYLRLEVPGHVENGLMRARVNPSIESFVLSEADIVWRVMVNFAGGVTANEHDITEQASYDERTGMLTLPASYAADQVSFVAQVPWMHPAHDLVEHWQRGDAAHEVRHTLGLETQATMDAVTDGSTYPITNVATGVVGSVAPWMLGKDFDTHNLATLCGYPELEGRYVFFVAFQKSNCRLFEMVDAVPGRAGSAGDVTTDYGDVIARDLTGYRWVTADCVEDVNNGREIFYVLEDAGSWVRVDAVEGTTLHCTFRLSVNGPGGANYQDVMGKFDLTIPYGALKLEKRSSDSAITDGNGSYQLRGATYGVYGDPTCTQLVGTLVTDDGGRATLGNLAPGNYWVRETAAPTGFALDGTAYPVTVRPGDTTSVNDGAVHDRPLYAELPLIVQKADAEGDGEPRGAATLVGTTFRVAYYDGTFSTVDDLPATASRTWFASAEALDGGGTGIRLGDMRYGMEGDDAYLSGDVTVLPLGTVVVTEVAPPDGYLLSDSSSHILHVIADETAPGGASIRAPDGSGNLPLGANVPQLVIRDHVRRGDLDFTKIDGRTMARLANVAFAITSNTTGETHVIVTDENGYASTAADWIAHTHATNANDAFVTCVDGGWTVIDDGALSANVGIWFAGRNAAGCRADDDRGALPFDTYTITELDVPANDGLSLVSFEITVSRDGITVGGGTVNDRPAPAIATTLTDSASGTHTAGARPAVELNDEVRYTALTPGATYELVGVLHAVTKEGMDGGTICDADGNPVTSRTTFVAEGESGNVSVTFRLDGSMQAGCSVVAFETLLREGEGVVATHADVGDVNQTVSFAALETQLSDAASRTKVVSSVGKATVVDEVSYRGLTPGVTYQLVGTLADAETGEVAQTADELPITGETTFVPESDSGHALVSFDFDASEQAGRTLVACQTLYAANAELVVHADLSNEAQSVTTPLIATTALDERSGTHEALADAATTIIDTVRYGNLIPGAEYELVATVVEAQTGRAVKGSQDDPAAHVTFTAAQAEGTIEMPIPIDARSLAGTSLTICEHLYQEGRLIAAHADPNDAEQTVRLPRVTTEASDAESGTHELASRANASVRDVISYQNLMPGVEYVLVGTLHGRDGDGEDMGILADADGHDAIATVTFVPEAGSGTLDLTFAVDARTLVGASIVAFEQVIRDGAIIAEHADIASDSQAVSVMRGSTSADLPRTGDDAYDVAPLLLVATSALLFGAIGIMLAHSPRMRRGRPRQP